MIWFLGNFPILINYSKALYNQLASAIKVWNYFVKKWNNSIFDILKYRMTILLSSQMPFHRLLAIHKSTKNTQKITGAL